MTELPIIGGNIKKEVFTPKTQTKVAAAVGLPDDKDLQNIENCINQYELARPGELQRFIAQAKKDQADLKNDTGSNHAKYKSTGKPSFRHAVSLPIGLYRMIEEAYPLMFSNTEHLHWFMRKFPKFNIARRI